MRRRVAPPTWIARISTGCATRLFDGAADSGTLTAVRAIRVPWRAAFVGALAALVWPASVQAESGGTCALGRIVEVYAGSDACPDADYVIVQLEGGGYAGPVVIENTCGALASHLSAGSSLSSQFPSPSELFIARPEAEVSFGLSADDSASSVPAVSGRLEYWCGTAGEVIYGGFPGANAPPLVSGKALKWNGTTWELGEPNPRNSAGQVGTVGACASVGGIDAGNVPTYPPCTGGTGGSSDSGATGGSAGSSGSPGGGGGSGGISGSGGNGGAGGYAATGGASTQDGSDAIDAGDGATSANDSGCGCRAAGAQGVRLGWLAFVIAWLFRRRLASGRGTPIGRQDRTLA